ncbi:Gfo/Idh/MocA family oxidoreductase [Gemmatimonas sp.]|uniref:Gfo/Idh/MocA family protein n=1 Tax=Gemmatimonas sp. TaxID=1962908 RepID=UPI00286DA5A2|nr:Gfo/Idh/MocA family oxidoreductase [Gemmatimonas sp.]
MMTTMRSQRLRIAILGCGYAARIHARALRRLPDVELTFASRDPARAAQYCKRYRGVASWGSYSDAVTDPQTAIVLVATPTFSHLELTLMALAASRHVVVEKPAFSTSGDFDVVRRAAAATGRLVCVAENYVYKPFTQKLRRHVERGDLGDVRFVLLNATRRQPAVGWRAKPELSGGGALFEAGVHWIAFAARIGLELTHVSGLRAGDDSGADLSSLTVFRYANGAVGSLAHSWELAAPLGGARLSTVQGTLGAVTFESNGALSVTSGRAASLCTHFRDTLGYVRMHEDFINAIRSGVCPYYTLEMAQQDFIWLEAAQQGVTAHESGVSVTDPPAHGSRHVSRAMLWRERGALDALHVAPVSGE